MKFSLALLLRLSLVTLRSFPSPPCFRVLFLDTNFLVSLSIITEAPFRRCLHTFAIKARYYYFERYFRSGFCKIFPEVPRSSLPSRDVSERKFRKIKPWILFKRNVRRIYFDVATVGIICLLNFQRLEKLTI